MGRAQNTVKRGSFWRSRVVGGRGRGPSLLRRGENCRTAMPRPGGPWPDLMAPSWSYLELCWPILGLCWPILGAMLPRLEVMWAHLGAMLAHLGAMLVPLGGYMLAHLGAMFALLDAYVGPCRPILSHKIRKRRKNAKSTKTP